MTDKNKKTDCKTLQELLESEKEAYRIFDDIRSGARVPVDRFTGKEIPCPAEFHEFIIARSRPHALSDRFWDLEMARRVLEGGFDLASQQKGRDFWWGSRLTKRWGCTLEAINFDMALPELRSAQQALEEMTRLRSQSTLMIQSIRHGNI